MKQTKTMINKKQRSTQHKNRKLNFRNKSVKGGKYKRTLRIKRRGGEGYDINKLLKEIPPNPYKPRRPTPHFRVGYDDKRYYDNEMEYDSFYHMMVPKNGAEGYIHTYTQEEYDKEQKKLDEEYNKELEIYNQKKKVFDDYVNDVKNEEKIKYMKLDLKLAKKYEDEIKKDGSYSEYDQYRTLQSLFRDDVDEIDNKQNQ